MTHAADLAQDLAPIRGRGTNSTISMMTAIFVGAIVFLCFSVSPAHATITAPAIKVGDYNASCKAFNDDAFFDIGTGGCYHCRASAPHRSIYSVNGGRYNGGRACFSKAYTKHKKAKYKRKATGVLNNKCRKGTYLWVGKGKCYVCPKGYKKTGLISSKRACSKRVAKDYAPAVFHGERGCPANSWRDLGTDNCFRCPKNSIRNLKFRGSPENIEACTYYKPDDMTKRFDRARYDNAESLGNMGDVETDWINGFATCREDHAPLMGDCLDLLRRGSMIALLEGEAAIDSDYTTVTWSKTAAVAHFAGVEGSKAFAMHRDSDGNFTCKKALTISGTLGVQTGPGYSESFSLQQGDLDDVPGTSIGYSYGGIGNFWAIEWDEETNKESLVRGFAAELDVGASITNSGTTTDDVVDCESLSW